eukprot:2967246-Amphidinium_carterae.1
MHPRTTKTALPQTIAIVFVVRKSVGLLSSSLASATILWSQAAPTALVLGKRIQKVCKSKKRMTIKTGLRAKDKGQSLVWHLGLSWFWSNICQSSQQVLMLATQTSVQEVTHASNNNCYTSDSS